MRLLKFLNVAILVGLLISSKISIANNQVVMCNIPPTNAVVQLFEIIEAPYSEVILKTQYQSLLSRSLLQVIGPQKFLSLLEDTKGKYFDNSKNIIPLSSRLMREPKVLEQNQRGYSNNPRSISISIISIGARGQIEQRMSIVCEDELWKIEAVSYGPNENFNLN